MASLGAAGAQAIETALRGGTGLRLDFGGSALTVRSRSLALARDLHATYRHFPFQPDGGADWADLHVAVLPARGLRRFVKPQVRFVCDGQEPFDPFPADTALPLLEWGANWLIGRRINDLLLLHAGVVERDGLALVMPATPGSGKSTLTAALTVRGWRLLSDEFGALDPATRLFRPMLKPVALKNRSIDVIRDFGPNVEMGPVFPKTRKGDVAHLCPPRDAVERRHETAEPGLIVLPQWQAGAATSWTPVPPEEAFPALAFNAFNYPVLGAEGFLAAVDVARRCPAWRLVYSDLEDALTTLELRWQDLREARARDAAAPTASTASAAAASAPAASA